MQVNISPLEAQPIADRPIEIAERKGLGHPDSICDALAEQWSLALSRFYLERFGLILHHNVDKALLFAGASRPGFGGGTLLEPIQLTLVRWIEDDHGKLEECEAVQRAAQRKLTRMRLRRDKKQATLYSKLLRIRKTFEDAFGQGTRRELEAFVRSGWLLPESTRYVPAALGRLLLEGGVAVNGNAEPYLALMPQHGVSGTPEVELQGLKAENTARARRISGLVGARWVLELERIR